ncbi:hypothetical protein Tco_1097977 [Tanacetum coccineum]
MSEKKVKEVKDEATLILTFISVFDLDVARVKDAETAECSDTDKTKSEGDTKILHIGEEQGDDVTNMVNLEEKTDELDQGQAGSDPGKTPESIYLHQEFMAHVYPYVHESLMFLADEHVILEEPLSSSGTLSSMKNLDDAYSIGDQFNK